MSSGPSDPSQQDGRRQRTRRGGSRCSHTTRLDVPSLDLGSNMSLQLAHERNGLLLSQAQTSTSAERASIMDDLRRGNVDLSKAQALGHCHQLTARLAESLLHHLLFAKNQLPEPVSLMRKKRQAMYQSETQQSRRRPRNSSTRERKQDKLLRKLDQLQSHLEQAVSQLSRLASNNGEGPSSRPDGPLIHALSSKDVRLLVVMGASASMPREVFVLDLLHAAGHCIRTGDVHRPQEGRREEPDSTIADEQMDRELAKLLTQMSDQQRDAARDKTSSLWERKLVRLLVSDERLESFLGGPIALTKMHLFLSAPTGFRCPGWSARPHLSFDLDQLCETRGSSDTTTESSDAPIHSADTSMSSHGPGRSSSISRQDESGRWSKAGCESSSSVADSWPEDSASDHLAESSTSSLSDDSRPPSATGKAWNAGGAAPVAEDWLPICSSPLGKECIGLDQDVELSHAGSSLGSSTVYGHDSSGGGAVTGQDKLGGDAVMESNEALLQLTAGSDVRVRRRSREPKAGSLLSRNLLKGNRSRQHSSAASDSSSTRGSIAFRRTPRCAGVQIDFSDPNHPARDMPEDEVTHPTLDRCWFQCEAVLEGFR